MLYILNDCMSLEILILKIKKLFSGTVSGIYVANNICESI